VSNPIFNSSSAFNSRGPVVRQAAQPGGVPGGDPRFASYGQYGRAGAAVADARTIEHIYGAPSATPVDTGRMTYDDVIMKTAGLLTVLVAVAAVTWFLAPELYVVGMVVGLVLGLVNAFRRTPSPALIVAYAIAEGVFLGGISYFFENQLGTQGGVELGLDSIVLQALLATAATFVATLLLFTSGKVRVSPKATRFFFVAMVGYGIFSLVNFGLMWFGGMDGFGLRSNVEVMGIPLGLVIGVLAVGLAAYSLIMDFDSIKRGVERGVPANLAWTAAFGLVVTLVWLYLEFLRILAILRNN
jgi:uncharacterized YccA/Bax inhibitor family protein